MFIGEYQASIDEKGRVSIPAKFRPSLKSKIVVTRGLDNSLFLYSLDEWKKLAEKLASLPISTANTRTLAGIQDPNRTAKQRHSRTIRLSRGLIYE